MNNINRVEKTKRGIRVYAPEKKIKELSYSYLKSKLSRNYFWSNPGGVFKRELIIIKILDGGSLNDLDFARFHFGDKIIKKLFKKHFKVKDKEILAHILDIS